jgi:hypothetical protein
MNKPVIMYASAIEPADMKVFAMVQPGGENWDVSVVLADDSVQTRTVPTSPRPDNGALHVSKMLRQQFHISGTFKSQ